MMRFVAFSVFLLGLTAYAIPASAEGLVHEMKIGGLNHDVGGLWSGVNRESGTDGNVELILNSGMGVWGGTVRPAVGISVNSSGDTSKIYGAARWETELGARGLFALGVGGAVHNGETGWVSPKKKALGSRVLFYFPIEAGFRVTDRTTVSLFFDHVSNAWLATPNEGMDTLGIRFGYRF